MSVAVKKAIFDKLTGDATLTGYLNAGTASVFNGLAPQESNAPYVSFHKQAGTPAYTLSARAWDNEIYTVKAITQGPSMASGGTIADRISAVLTDQALTIAGATHLYLRRESDIEYQETAADGVIFNHVGATYRVWSA